MDKTVQLIIVFLAALVAVVAGAVFLNNLGDQPSDPQIPEIVQNNTTEQPADIQKPVSVNRTPDNPELNVTIKSNLTPPESGNVSPQMNKTSEAPKNLSVTETLVAAETWDSPGDDNCDRAPPTRKVTDMTGRVVSVPKNVKRVVTLYTPAAAMVMSIDGSADRLSGVDRFASIDEGFRIIDPSIADKPVVSGSGIDVNKEAILATDPDVIIAGSWSEDGLSGIGVPVVLLNTNGFEDVDGALTVIGSVLGKTERAKTLVSYLDNRRSALIDQTSTIPEHEQDSLYIAWRSPLSTFAGGEFHEDWANNAGFSFASSELTGHRQEVSLEQIITWNPDVFLLPGNGNPEDLLTDPEWQSIDAVKHGRVYSMPRFVGDWGSPVPEAILGMEWLANGTYHDVVDLDMVQETQNFYSLFYDYDLSADEAEEIMGATPAPHIRTVTVTDGAGREVEFELPVESIVTNYPPAVRMVTTLGAAEKLTGVDSITQGQDDQFILKLYPDIKSLTCVGNPRTLDLETTLGLDPDLLLVAGWNTDQLDHLESLGIPTFGVIAENHNQITGTMQELGRVLECEDIASSFTGTYEDGLEAVQSQTSGLTSEERPDVYLGGCLGMLSTATGDMLQNSIIESAGGENVAENLTGTRWAEVSKEQILGWNPDVILLVPYQSADTPESVLADPDFASLNAVKNGQVYWFPSDICEWDSPSPQTWLGIEWLGKTLHPDLFTDTDVNADADAFYEEFYGTSFSDLGGTL